MLAKEYWRPFMKSSLIYSCSKSRYLQMDGINNNTLSLLPNFKAELVTYQTACDHVHASCKNPVLSDLSYTTDRGMA